MKIANWKAIAVIVIAVAGAVVLFASETAKTAKTEITMEVIGWAMIAVFPLSIVYMALITPKEKKN